MSILLVCGFGHCGSSLVMQMLAAGGHPVTGTWPDFEGSKAASASSAAEWRAMDGRAVKVLDLHERPLPRGLAGRAVWLDRDPTQQALSQAKFLRWTMGIALDRHARRALAQSYRADRPAAIAALHGFDVMHMTFDLLLARPRFCAERLAEFAGGALDVGAMSAVVRPRSPRCYDGCMEAEMLGGGSGAQGAAP